MAGHALRSDFLYKNANNEDTAYSKLPIHQQRAVLNEANVQLKAYQLSKRYGEWAKEEENAKKLLAHFCEKYASNNNTVTKLAIKDSQEIYLYPLTAERMARREHCLQGIAKKLDAGRIASPNNLDPAVLTKNSNQGR